MTSNLNLTAALNQEIPQSFYERKDANCENITEWLVEFFLSEFYLWEAFAKVVKEAGLFPSLSPRPDAGQWMEWYDDNSTRNNTIDALYGIGSLALMECENEYCSNLDWQGSSDIAGTGMMATYYVEAILACIYAVVLCIEPCVKRHKLLGQRHQLKIMSKLLTAIVETSTSLLGSMILFSLSMLVATLFAYAAALAHEEDPDKAITDHERACLLFLTIFSIFPPILLQMFMSPLRRGRLRKVVWGLIGALTIIDRVLAEKAPSLELLYLFTDIDKKSSRKVLWEQDCSPKKNLMWGSIKGAEIATVIAVTFWLALKVPWLRRFEAYGLRRSAWKTLVALLSFTGMWTFLGVFTAYRSESAKTSGDSNEEMGWRFGQVLALATWAPLFVDIAYLFCFGPEEGLQGNVSTRFRVLKALGVDDGQHKSDESGLPLVQRRRPTVEESHLSLELNLDEEEDLGLAFRMEERLK